MQIGILTQTDSSVGYNYGATLQCLALQNLLRSWGHEVIVFDFKSADDRSFLYKALNYLTAATNIFEFMGVCHEIMVAILAKSGKKGVIDSKSLKNKFDKFIGQNLNMSSCVNENNIAKIANNLDAVIVGSDQVWSGFARKKLVYLFDWTPIFEGKRISYAACSARKGVSWMNRRKIATCMKQMNAISVRDIQTAVLVRKASGLKAEIVLDPTFLYDFDKYMEPVNISGAYILAYILGEEIEGGFVKTLQEIRNNYSNLKLVVVALPGHGEAIYKHADVLLTDCSPGQWLTLFSRASFVLTDSFHGVCFSLKYKREFLAYYKTMLRASRLLDLRNRFNLDGNIVASLKEAIRKKSFQKNIDYASIDKILAIKKKSSIEFLEGSLKK